MEVQKAYEIFTDASYDNVTKVGTYAIVIMQENKVEKIIAKKCNIQLENSTECEVFAIIQHFKNSRYKTIKMILF